MSHASMEAGSASDPVVMIARIIDPEALEIHADSPSASVEAQRLVADLFGARIKQATEKATAIIAALARSPAPAVPESVRRLEPGDEAVFACACARWVRALLASDPPSGRAGEESNEATQVTLGEGLVDITRIDHEGRSGVLFRPRAQAIPFGEPGELPEGKYWPVKGDVVLWVSGDGPAVAIEALEQFLPAAPAPASAGVVPEGGWVADEPTPEMYAAARDWSRGKYGMPIGNEAARGCWQAMLWRAPVDLCALVAAPKPAPAPAHGSAESEESEGLAEIIATKSAEIEGAFGREMFPAAKSIRGIYIASKTAHAPRWRQLRADGAPIISTWIDEAGKGETACFTDLWERCIDEAATATALIVYREPGEVLKGAFVEVGAALSVGVPVYAIGCDEFSFAHHAGVTRFDSLERALSATQPATPAEGR